MKKEEFGSFEDIQDMSNISRILKESKKAILSKDWMKLKNLSNQTIHSATIHQDPVNIVIAVLVYSFSKVLQRENYQKMEEWDLFYKYILENWDLMIKASLENKKQELLGYAGEIRNYLNNIDGNLGEYIKDIFRKAEINKAFKLYEHGISSAQTAELLGISLWDLASYIGQSNIFETHVTNKISEKQRIKIVEDFFK
ncbi:MAG: hypothetical protein WC260_02730 [Candidatus Pacearchaeota archaeon]